MQLGAGGVMQAQHPRSDGTGQVPGHFNVSNPASDGYACRSPDRRPALAHSSRFQRRFSGVPALAVTFGTSLGPCGEVVIIVLGDGQEEMEITLINCQADKSDEAACHHIP